MIRVSRQTKSAVDPRWQAETVPHNDIEEWVDRGENVGIQGGPQSGGFAPIDLDAPEARKLAPMFLPETLTASKGDEAPSHYVYIADGMPYIKIKSADGGELLAAKTSPTAGHYIVVEPSEHPTKGAYKWNGGFDAGRITRVSPEDLEMRIGMLGAASIIAQHLPRGDRHEYAKDLAGYLLRGGESPEDVSTMLRGAWHAGDALTPKAQRDIEDLVEDTRERLESDLPVTGGVKLRAEIHPKLPDLLARTLGWSKGRKRYEHTDSGNAERFVAARGDDFLWVRERNEWVVWDGTRWAPGSEGQVREALRAALRDIHKDADLVEDQKQRDAIYAFERASQNKQRIDGAMQAVQDKLHASEEDFDLNPWVLNVENGTIDLRTGSLRAHDRADKITKLAPVKFSPTAKAPRFQKFLKQTLVDPELIAFVQRYLGYSLTGSTEERSLAVLYGVGKNGKSTLVELFLDLLGDYATAADADTIMQQKFANSTRQYQLAELRGVRFVSMSETKRGAELEESVVKQITGNDTINARAPFGRPFSYRPMFKLWMSTNHKPEIPDGSEAIWDRMKLIPFTQRFDGKSADPKLPEKLREELPGVLLWAVRGCVDWNDGGLGTSKAVEAATAEYRSETDVIDRFFEDACEFGPDKWSWTKELFEAWEAWALDEGEDVGKPNGFSRVMKERGVVRGFSRERAKKSTYWQGISSTTDNGTPPKTPAKHGGVVEKVYDSEKNDISTLENPSCRDLNSKTENTYIDTPQGENSGTMITFDDDDEGE